jgi:hypothetical protein
MNSQKSRVLMLIGFVLILSRCGGGAVDSSSGGGGVTRPTPCSMTLSGEVTGTFECSSAIAVFSPQQNVTVLWVGYSNLSATAAGIIWIQFNFEIAGRPQTTTYTQATARIVDASVSVNGAQGPTFYEASTGQSTGSSLRITITGLDPWPATPETGFDMHGTADATIPYLNGPGARGNITLHATF